MSSTEDDGGGGERRRWNEVIVNFDVAEETLNFGPRRDEATASTCLYQAHTLATIGCGGGDDDTTVTQINKENRPPASGEITSTEILTALPVITANNGRFVAIACECDVNVFSCGDTFQLKNTFSVPVTVRSLCWMSSVDVLVIGVVANLLIFIDINSGTVLFKKKVSRSGDVSSKCLVDHLEAVIVGGDCVLWAIAQDGTAVRYRFAKYAQWTNCIDQGNFTALKKLRESLLDETQGQIGTAGLRACILEATDDSLKAYICAGSLQYNNLASFGAFDADCLSSVMDRSGAGDEATFVKTAISNSGRFLFALRDRQEIIVFDLWTSLTPVRRIAASGVRDFVLIPTQTKSSRLSANRILLIRSTEKEDTALIQICSLPDMNPIYSLSVHNCSYLVSGHSCGDELLIVEPMLNEHNQFEYWRVVGLHEALSSDRLSRMLAKGEFESAEMFARQFGLDTEVVYAAELAALLQEMAASKIDNSPVFTRYKAVLAKTLSINTVVKGCVDGAVLLSRLSWMTELLDFGLRRIEQDNSGDARNEVAVRYLKQLHGIKRQIGTYRLLYGDMQADRWKRFYETKTWLPLLVEFLRDGAIDSVRILLARYNTELLQELKTAWDSVFGELLTTATTCESAVREDLLRLVEYDLVPLALSDAPQTNCDLVTAFLCDLITFMESGAKAAFPRNALHCAEMIDRVVRRWFSPSNSDPIAVACATSSVAVTRRQLADAAYVASTISFDTPASNSGLCRLRSLSNSLRRLDRLKTVYDCQMSLAELETGTVESLCYRILDRVCAELLANSVEKYAKPYMHEHRLDEDNVLCSYVMDIIDRSSGATGDGGSLMWEERCLVILDCIREPHRHCRAVTELVKRARLPWSVGVETAVQKALESGAECVPELRSQKRFADLRLLLCEKYGFGSQLVNDALRRTNTMRRLLLSLLMGNVGSQRDRLRDAVTVIQLIGQNSTFTTADLYISFLVELLKRGNFQTDDAMSVLNGLERGCAVNYAMRAARCCRLILDSPILSGETRTHLLDSVLLLNSRWCDKDGNEQQQHSSPSDHQDALALSRLAQNNRVYRWSNFVDDATKEKELRRAIEETPSFCWGAMRRFAVAYRIADFTAFRITVSCFLDKGNIAAVNRFLAIGCEAFTFDDLNQIDCLLSVLGPRILKVAISNSDSQSTHLLAATLSLLRHICCRICRHCHVSKLIATVKAISLATFCQTVLQQFQDIHSSGNASERIYGLEKRCRPSIRFDSEGRSVDYDHASRIRSAVLLALTNDCGENWLDLSAKLLETGRHLLALCCVLRRRSAAVDATTAAIVSSTARACLEQLCARSKPDLWLTFAVIQILSPTEAYQFLTSSLKQLAPTFIRQPTVVEGITVLSAASAILSGKREYVEMLKAPYLKAIWSKRLAREGIHIKGSELASDEVLCALALKMVPVEVVEAFVNDFNLDATDACLTFARALLTDSNQRTFKDRLKLASRVLCVVQPSTRFNDGLARLFDELDPYNYEAIDVLLTICASMHDKDSLILYRVPLSKLGRLFDFLALNGRVSAPTADELRWWRERGAKSDTPSPTAAYSDLDLNFDIASESAHATTDTTGVIGNRTGNPSLDCDLPPSSAHRLPFHAFLPVHISATKIEASPVLAAVLKEEVTLETVQCWQRFATDACPVRISANQMLIELIMANLQRSKASKSAGAVDETVVEKILALLRTVQDRKTALKCTTSLIKHLPLGKSKLGSIKLGEQLSKDWQDELNKKTKPAPEDVEMARRSVSSFGEAYLRFGVEFVLEQNGWLTDTARSLIPTPTRLIGYLCEQIHKGKVESLLKTVRVISQMNGLDLDKLQWTLVEKWLRHSLPEQSIDENEVTLVGSNLMSAVATEDQEASLPFFDEPITKTVQLLSSKERKTATYRLRTTAENSANPTQVRINAICALMRLASPKQLRIVFPDTAADTLRDSLIELLYVDRLQRLRISMPLGAFGTSDKLALVRTLWSHQDISPVLVCQTIAGLIIDYRLSEMSIAKNILQTLNSTRDIPLMLHLLAEVYRQKHGDFKLISDVAITAFQSAMRQYCHPVSHDGVIACRAAVLQLLRCPVVNSKIRDVSATGTDLLQLPKLSNLLRIVFF